MAEPPGDVADVAERSGLMALENVGVQVETLPLRTAFRKLVKWLSLLPAKVRTSFPSKSKSEVSADDSFSAFEYPTALEVRIERLGFQTSRFGDDGFASEIKHRNLCVRCLRCIRVPKTSSVTDDSAAKSRYPEAPAGNIE